MAENMNAKDVKEEEPMLVVKNLHVSFDIMAGKVDAVNGVSFSLKKGGILGIVGESGSGKSVSNYSIMQILDKNGHIDSGSIRFCGKELIGLSEKEMRKIRGDRIAIIFQDPMSGLNPVYTVGNQLIEAIRTLADQQSQPPLEQSSPFSVGELVSVADGPLKGLTGIVSEIARERVFVMLTLLGREKSIALPADQLTPG